LSELATNCYQLKSIKICENSFISVFEDFDDVGKIVKAETANKDIGDIKLTRYTCYLIAQNVCSKKR